MVVVVMMMMMMMVIMEIEIKSPERSLPWGSSFSCTCTSVASSKFAKITEAVEFDPSRL